MFQFGIKQPSSTELYLQCLRVNIFMSPVMILLRYLNRIKLFAKYCGLSFKCARVYFALLMHKEDYLFVDMSTIRVVVIEVVGDPQNINIVQMSQISEGAFWPNGGLPQ